MRYTVYESDPWTLNIAMAPKKYGFWNFIFDCIMVLLTWGLWLIWIFVREMRKR